MHRISWGSNILLKEGDLTSCQDVLALEWSGSGRGDYRESPLELLGKSSDFRFDSFRILEGGAGSGEILRDAGGGAVPFRGGLCV